jgi:hypothetical protein
MFRPKIMFAPKFLSIMEFIDRVSDIQYWNEAAGESEAVKASDAYITFVHVTWYCLNSPTGCFGVLR